MKVLITNDDGINSEWMHALALEIQKKHDVYIVAPKTEMSAKSHSVTLRTSMELEKIRIDGIKNDCYSLTGTPADCVRIAAEIIYDDIDLVFAGINKGYNSGMDILYSGTIGAASEANVYDIPSVAVSAEFGDKTDYKMAAEEAVKIYEKYKDLIADKRTVLSINVPGIKKSEIKGEKICKLGTLVSDTFELKEENGKKNIKTVARKPYKIIENSDHYYLKQGYITITPLRFEFTNEDLIQKFKNI